MILLDLMTFVCRICSLVLLRTATKILHYYSTTHTKPITMLHIHTYKKIYQSASWIKSIRPYDVIIHPSYPAAYLFTCQMMHVKIYYAIPAFFIIHVHENRRALRQHLMSYPGQNTRTHLGNISCDITVKEVPAGSIGKVFKYQCHFPQYNNHTP